MKQVFLSAFAAATVLLCGVASAQAPVSNPLGVLPDVSLRTIQPLLQEMGAETEIRTINYEEFMFVRLNGRFLRLKSRVCSNGVSGCAGLWITAFINGETPDTQMINAFNTGSPPTRATLQGGSVILDRYLIADYGITRGSLAVNFSVAVGGINAWFEFFSQYGRSSSVAYSAEQAPASGFTHDELEFLNLLSSAPQEGNEAIPAKHKVRKRR